MLGKLHLICMKTKVFMLKLMLIKQISCNIPDISYLSETQKSGSKITSYII